MIFDNKKVYATAGIFCLGATILVLVNGIDEKTITTYFTEKEDPEPSTYPSEPSYPPLPTAPPQYPEYAEPPYPAPTPYTEPTTLPTYPPTEPVAPAPAETKVEPFVCDRATEVCVPLMVCTPAIAESRYFVM